MSRPELGIGEGSRTPVAHEARGWGWGFWTAALQECLLDRNEAGRGNVFHGEGQNGIAGEELLTWCGDTEAEENSLL